MIIHVYSIMYNEEVMLPYFLRHYETFTDKIFIIIDEKTTDKTEEIARAHKKVTILDYDFKGIYDNHDHNNCFIKAYKKNSRDSVDWVMLVDGDEIVYHKDMKKYLKEQRNNGARILKLAGFSMISKELPTMNKQIYEELYHGVRERRYDKPIVFDPSLDLMFTKGRHYIENESAEISRPDEKAFLLHYRWLSRDYFKNRSENLINRVGHPKKISDRLKVKGLNYYDTMIKKDLPKVI